MRPRPSLRNSRGCLRESLCEGLCLDGWEPESERRPLAKSALDLNSALVRFDNCLDNGKAQAMAVLKVTLGVLYSKANTGKVLGLHVASDWNDMLELMKKYNDLKTDLPASAFYTNDFLPK